MECGVECGAWCDVMCGVMRCVECDVGVWYDVA